jgi:hypothetical protein
MRMSKCGSIRITNQDQKGSISLRRPFSATTSIFSKITFEGFLAYEESLREIIVCGAGTEPFPQHGILAGEPLDELCVRNTSGAAWPVTTLELTDPLDAFHEPLELACFTDSLPAYNL